MDCNFSDGIIGLSVVGGVVRIDLGRIVPSSAPAGSDGKAPPAARVVPVQQLVMPIDGFVRSFQAQRQLMDRLEKSGVLAKLAGPAVATGGSTGPQSVK